MREHEAEPAQSESVTHVQQTGYEPYTDQELVDYATSELLWHPRGPVREELMRRLGKTAQ